MDKNQQYLHITICKFTLTEQGKSICLQVYIPCTRRQDWWIHAMYKIECTVSFYVLVFTTMYNTRNTKNIILGVNYSYV